jgi:hypothetical protein
VPENILFYLSILAYFVIFSPVMLVMIRSIVAHRKTGYYNRDRIVITGVFFFMAELLLLYLVSVFLLNKNSFGLRIYFETVFLIFLVPMVVLFAWNTRIWEMIKGPAPKTRTLYDRQFLLQIERVSLVIFVFTLVAGLAFWAVSSEDQSIRNAVNMFYLYSIIDLVVILAFITWMLVHLQRKQVESKKDPVHR